MTVYVIIVMKSAVYGLENIFKEIYKVRTFNKCTINTEYMT